MGLIGTVLEFLRTTVDDVPVTDIKVDPGGGPNLTGELFQGAGDDARALPTDRVHLVEIPGTGRYIAIGFLDPVNEPTALEGERRLYSRDADGVIQVTIRLTNDGFVHLAEDDPAEFIPRDDRLQAQLDDIKASIDDLQDAHDNHIHITSAVTGGGGTAGVIQAPVKVTTVPYEVGDTATDKVKGT